MASSLAKTVTRCEVRDAEQPALQIVPAIENGVSWTNLRTEATTR